ncbi:MAG: cell surface protein, partial [Alphaproteobacteria bacterium]|nr:cell surface protein [Alphaproteobacteria bacterium]
MTKLIKPKNGSIALRRALMGGSAAVAMGVAFAPTSASAFECLSPTGIALPPIDTFGASDGAAGSSPDRIACGPFATAGAFGAAAFGAGPAAGQGPAATGSFSTAIGAGGAIDIGPQATGEGSV